MDREGEEHTEDVDIYASPSGVIVPVFKGQVIRVAVQLLLR